MNDQIRAANLPTGSIVANDDRICYLTGNSHHFPWDAVEFSRRSVTNVSHLHVDQFLSNGAKVLRHGYGEERP